MFVFASETIASTRCINPAVLIRLFSFLSLYPYSILITFCDARAIYPIIEYFYFFNPISTPELSPWCHSSFGDQLFPSVIPASKSRIDSTDTWFLSLFHIIDWFCFSLIFQLLHPLNHFLGHFLAFSDYSFLLLLQPLHASSILSLFSISFLQIRFSFYFIDAPTHDHRSSFRASHFGHTLIEYVLPSFPQTGLYSVNTTALISFRIVICQCNIDRQTKPKTNGTMIFHKFTQTQKY